MVDLILVIIISIILVSGSIIGWLYGDFTDAPIQESLSFLHMLICVIIAVAFVVIAIQGYCTDEKKPEKTYIPVEEQLYRIK